MHRPSRGPLWAARRPDAHGALAEQIAPTLPDVPFATPPELPEPLELPELPELPDSLGLPERAELPEQALRPVAKRATSSDSRFIEMRCPQSAIIARICLCRNEHDHEGARDPGYGVDTGASRKVDQRRRPTVSRRVSSGAWWPCAADGGESFCFPGEPVDITADNTWRLLVSDGTGGLAGAQGLQAEGTYGLPNEAGFACGSSCDVGVSPLSGGLFGMQCWVRDVASAMLVGGVEWFVAIGP